MDIHYGLTENFTNYVKSFFEKDYRYYAVYGARDSGKSFTTAIIVLRTLLKYRNVKFVLARNYQTEVGRSQFQQLCDVISHYNLEAYFKIYQQNKRIVCKLTGSYTINVGTKEPQTMKSLAEITHAWIEEADQISELGLIELQQVVRSEKSKFKNKIILTFNPCARRKWIYAKFFDGNNLNIPDEDKSLLYDVEGRRKDTYYNFSSYLENNYISAETKASIEELKYINEILYRRYTLGEFVDEEYGKIFNPSMIKEYSGNSLGRGVVYVDEAFSLEDKADYTGIIKASSDGKLIYIEDAFVGRIELEEQMSVLRSMYDHRHKDIGYDAWSTQDKMYNEIMYNSFKAHNVRARVHPLKKDIDGYIKFMLKLLLDKKIVFSSSVLSNKLFMEQLYNFSGKKAQEYDDGVDALFCAVHLLVELEYFRYK